VTRRVLAVVGLCVAVLAACSTSSGAQSATELTVFGAASLKAALEAVTSAYEAANPGTTITVATDSSAALETQIEQGAPADVFVSADEPNMTKVVDAGASVAAFALRSGLDVVVRTTARLRAGRPYPLVDHGEMLDLLTPLEQGTGTDVLTLPSLFTGGLGGAAVLVVTGPRGPSTVFTRGDQISVARIGAGADTAGLNCPAIAAAHAAQFAERWAQWS